MVQILAILADRNAVTVGELAGLLRISHATLRRDLAALEEQGLLCRTHGGARPFGAPAELPIRLRNTQARAAKVAIARKAAELLPPGRLVVALSGGSTTAEVARRLAGRNDLTIITNSLTTAAEIASHQNLRVIMTGGAVRSSSFELVGSLAEHTFNAINVNIAILGADGVTADGGATTHDDTEARTNRAMASHAQRLMVVADARKIGRLTLARVADATAIDDLVTDDAADPAELDRLRDKGITLHIVSPE
jgi:DeoR family transcriptional regulator of aga operon